MWCALVLALCLLTFHTGIVRVTQPAHSREDVWKGGWGKAALHDCDFLPRLMVGPIHILSDDTVPNSANLL